MKETINYFFNIYPSIVYEIDNGVYFYYRGIKYYFVKYLRDVREIDLLVKVSNQLYEKKEMVNTFITSNKGTFYVNVDDSVYVLLRVNSEEDDNYNLKDIVRFNNLAISENFNMSDNWAILWEKRVDELESEMLDLNNDYPLVQNSFDYYIGLAENAISYFKDTIVSEDIKTCKININHNRISSKAYSGQINNPLSFTFDYEVRDIAEYIKSKFFVGDLDYFEVEDILIKSNFSKCSLMFLFARLIYPSYYFDMVNDIFVYDKDEEELLVFIDKIDEYEDFLNDVYNIINRKVGVPPIDWLVNK